jgi:predicted signal transduction protein with EAL and GGDEF domain
VLDFLNAPIRLGIAPSISAPASGSGGTLIECTSSELFRRADIAMYHAKMTGKGRVTHYDASSTAREQQLALEDQIRGGL